MTGRGAIVAVAVVAASAFLAGCVASPFGERLLVVVSAPREGGGLTIFAATQGGMLPSAENAEFEIRYGEETVYPPGGSGAEFAMRRDGGAVFVPYSLFVVGNGDYEVLVRHEGKQIRSRATIEKWVSFVYLHPFDRGSKIVVDAQLSRSTGGLPTDRILAEGDLILELHYRGADGKRDKFLGPALKIHTSPSESFTRIEVPRSRFSEGAGYYSVEPVFHNDQAKGNYWVPADPTMEDRNPPWNWIHVKR